MAVFREHLLTRPSFVLLLSLHQASCLSETVYVCVCVGGGGLKRHEMDTPLLQHARGSQQDTKTNAQCNYLLIGATCRRPFMTLIPLALWVLASICLSVSVFGDPPNPSCIDVCTKPSLGDCLSGVLTDSSIVFLGNQWPRRQRFHRKQRFTRRLA